MNYEKLEALYTSQKGKYENAKQMGMTYQAIQNIIKKEGNLKVSTLEKIARFYNVPVGYFFDEAEADGRDVKDVEIERLKGQIKGLKDAIRILKSDIQMPEKEEVRKGRKTKRI